MGLNEPRIQIQLPQKYEYAIILSIGIAIFRFDLGTTFETDLTGLNELEMNSDLATAKT